MSGPRNALAVWGASALRPVVLPTGMKALVKLPDVNELLSRDQFPAELRDLAMKYATDGIDVATLDIDELRRFVHFSYELIGRTLKYLAPPDSDAWDKFLTDGGAPADEGWQPVSLSAAEIAEMDVDQGDLTALGEIAGRRKTPNEVTAFSKLDRGESSVVDVQDAQRAAAGGRTSDFAGFRERSERDAARDDGEDVRVSPERGAADSRPGRRVRGRRGGSPATTVRGTSRSEG